LRRFIADVQEAFYLTHKDLSGSDFTLVGIKLPAYSYLFGLCCRSHSRMGCAKRNLVGIKKNFEVPSLGYPWIRPGSKEISKHKITMTTTAKLFSFFLCVALLGACATGESNLLSKAREIQNNLLSSYASVDSTMKLSMSAVNTQIEEFARDSTMGADTLKVKTLAVVNEKHESLMAVQKELQTWREELKLLPSTEEIQHGAKNPFGDEAKDQDILNMLKKSQENLKSIQTKITALANQ
jgi:hypothetical protein